jgi:HSP20 family protein
MAIKDLIPWRKRRREVSEKLPSRSEVRDIFEDAVEDFFESWGLEPRWQSEVAISPALDVAETDSEYKITAELPGMSRDDIDVTLEQGRLTISGTKEEEQKEEKENYVRTERSYGSFTRTVPLPATVDEENIEANFKDGVLSLRLPKTEEARGRKVPIQGE